MPIPINMAYFTGGAKPLENVDISGISDTPEKKKRTRKTSSVNDIVVANVEPEVPLCQTNKPYQDTYAETNSMLRQTISQIDSVSSDIMHQIDDIKGSKTLKRKYDYLGNLVNTHATLINSKISAVREINHTITQCHDLEMKRSKEIMKVTTADKADTDKFIMDTYNAFISAPTSNNVQYAPPIASMVSGGNPMQSLAIPPVGITSNDQYDAGYANYMNNLTPEANMMILESNPNIKTVVRYNPETGNRIFDVVDMTTGQSIPNTPKPAPMFLEDTYIDTKTNIAKNNNLNTAYPVIITPGL